MYYITGTQLEIDNALHLIREKFPLNRYPEVTLEQVSFIPPVTTVPLVTDQLYVSIFQVFFLICWDFILTI